MVRACRFAARFGFNIEPDAFDAIRSQAHKITAPGNAERIQGEVVKAMGMDKPSYFFMLLHDTGLLSLILRALTAAIAWTAAPTTAKPYLNTTFWWAMPCRHPCPHSGWRVFSTIRGKPMQWKSRMAATLFRTREIYPGHDDRP